MVQLIQAENAFTLKEYVSFSNAVDAAKKTEVVNAEKLEMINGKIVKDYIFRKNFLYLHFDSGVYLTVSIGEEAMLWDVVSTKPEVSESVFVPDICFEFSSGSQVSWNWKEILNSFIGKQAVISPSDQLLFIFYRGGAEYLIDVWANKKDPSDRYLVVSEA